MRRRYLLIVSSLLSVAWLAFRLAGRRASWPRSLNQVRKQAVELDRLASGIHSVADAQRYVDFVATMFAAKVPRTWRTKSLRRRIAQSEYAAASDPRRGIAEQRVADAWNVYAKTIGAPEASRVSAAEVHDLRNAFLTMARLAEHREYKNIWTVASIYSTWADGSLASGCRPVEAIRILWDLANMPDNLQAARERVRRGVLVSEEFRGALERPGAARNGAGRVEVRIRPVDPMRLARRQYIAKHGEGAWRSLVVTMMGKLLTDHAEARSLTV